MCDLNFHSVEPFLDTIKIKVTIQNVQLRSINGSLFQLLSIEPPLLQGFTGLSLVDLDDVNVSTTTDTWVLSWDSTQNKFVLKPPSVTSTDFLINNNISNSLNFGLGFLVSTVGQQSQVDLNISLNDLSNVVLNSPLTNQSLVFNGTNWVNANINTNSNLTVGSNTGIDTLNFSSQFNIQANNGTANISFIDTYSLPDLTDVFLNTPTQGQLLRYNGSTWSNSALSFNPNHFTVLNTANVTGIDLISQSIDWLSDVTINNPISGQTLTYNGLQWVNSNSSNNAPTLLDDLTDVLVTNPIDSDFLRFDGTKWVNTSFNLGSSQAAYGSYSLYEFGVKIENFYVDGFSFSTGQSPNGDGFFLDFNGIYFKSINGLSEGYAQRLTFPKEFDFDPNDFQDLNLPTPANEAHLSWKPNTLPLTRVVSQLTTNDNSSEIPVGTQHLINSSSGSFTLQAPSIPSDGDNFSLIDVGNNLSVNPVTITCDSPLIFLDSGTNTIVLDKNGETFEFIKSSNTWVRNHKINSSSQSNSSNYTIVTTVQTANFTVLPWRQYLVQNNRTCNVLNSSGWALGDEFTIVASNADFKTGVTIAAGSGVVFYGTNNSLIRLTQDNESITLRVVDLSNSSGNIAFTVVSQTGGDNFGRNTLKENFRTSNFSALNNREYPLFLTSPITVTLPLTLTDGLRVVISDPLGTVSETNFVTVVGNIEGFSNFIYTEAFKTIEFEYHSDPSNSTGFWFIKSETNSCDLTRERTQTTNFFVRPNKRYPVSTVSQVVNATLASTAAWRVGDRTQLYDLTGTFAITLDGFSLNNCNLICNAGQTLNGDTTRILNRDCTFIEIEYIGSGKFIVTNYTDVDLIQGNLGGSGTISDGDKGDITVSGSGSTWVIDNDVVTFGKIQNVGSGVLLGRSTAGTGDIETVAIGSGLALSGGTLTATVGSPSFGSSQTNLVEEIVVTSPVASISFNPNNLIFGEDYQLVMSGFLTSPARVDIRVNGDSTNTGYQIQFTSSNNTVLSGGRELDSNGIMSPTSLTIPSLSVATFTTLGGVFRWLSTETKDSTGNIFSTQWWGRRTSSISNLTQLQLFARSTTFAAGFTARLYRLNNSTNLVNRPVQTSNFTATRNSSYPIDSSAAPVTATLDLTANWIVGDRVTFFDEVGSLGVTNNGFSLNSFTIASNAGQNIAGSSSLVLNTDCQTVTLIYRGSGRFNIFAN